MPHRTTMTPDEQSILRLLRRSGSPEKAGQELMTRLAELEAAVAAAESALTADESDPMTCPSTEDGVMD